MRYCVCEVLFDWVDYVLYELVLYDEEDDKGGKCGENGVDYDGVKIWVIGWGEWGYDKCDCFYFVVL